MADYGEPPEITALRTNLTSLTDTVTVGDNLQWFSNCLVEKAFITQRAAQAILGGGATPANKAGQLIDGVFAVIRTSDRKNHWFAELVSIFSTDRAYAELVEKLKRHVLQTNQRQLQSPIPASPSASSSLHVPASSGTTPAISSEESPAPSSTTTSSSPPVRPPPAPHNPSTHSFLSPEKVKATIQELEAKFLDLNTDAEEEICEKEARDKNFLRKFRKYLQLLPAAKKAPHVKFFRECEQEILGAKDARAILAILCRYIDYRNYGILRDIVLKFCGPPLQTSMQDYCKMLEVFETSTSVDVYISTVPDEVTEDQKKAFSEMVVKIDKPASQCTLHDVRKLNEAIIANSSLCPHSVYISGVANKCVEVVVRFPPSVVGWVLAALTPHFMTTHHLSEVTVDGSQLSLLQDLRYDLVCRCVLTLEGGFVMKYQTICWTLIEN